MTILSKAARLIEALTELPNAAMACVEMAREAHEFKREAEAFSRMPAVDFGGLTIAEFYDKTRAEILLGNAERARDYAMAKLATVEAELNREREARRHRLQCDDGAPCNVRVLEFTPNGKVCICPGQEVLGASTWRYLSPEDMP